MNLLSLASSQNMRRLSGQLTVSLAQPPDDDGKPGTSRFSILGYTGKVIDWYGMRFVIRLAGIKARRKMPVLREHVRDRIVGSTEKWQVDEAGFHVEGVFSAVTHDGEEVLALAREGFPWQASIGVSPLKVVVLERGASAEVNGEMVEGPVEVWEESEVAEVSFVSLGADNDTEAKALASTTEECRMDKKKFALLVSLGLPKDAGEEEAMEFEKRLTEAGVNLSAMPAPQQAAEDGAAAAKEEAAEEEPDDPRKALAAERKRIAEIDRLVNTFSLPAEMACALRQSDKTIDQVRREVLAHLAKENPRVGTVSEGLTESEKFRAFAAQGVMMRLGMQPEKGERFAAEAQDFRYMTLQELAKMCLEHSGIATRRMSRNQVADAILSPRARLSASTSDFSSLFLDVARKILLQAYSAAPPTWQPITRKVNATDFKTMYGVALSEGGTLDTLVENEEYKAASLQASTESYKVVKRGKIINLSWEMIVNDDLNAFARLPQIFGNMAARTYADVVWGLVLNNPNMSDGTPVFHASHGNLASAAALTTATLDAAYNLMRVQKGKDGTPLDIRPRYLCVPPTRRNAAMILLNSVGDVTSGMSSGVFNPWQGVGMQVIEEPRLRTGTDPWFLFADPALANTIDVAFLDGREEPDIIEHDEFVTDAISYKIRAVMGAGWMDFRGAVKNAGASS